MIEAVAGFGSVGHQSDSFPRLGVVLSTRGGKEDSPDPPEERERKIDSKRENPYLNPNRGF